MLQGCYNIPLSQTFSEDLATNLLHSYKNHHFGLASITLFLPTARACLAMRDAFLRSSNNSSVIMPKMIPLSEIDETTMLPFTAHQFAQLKPPISPLKRDIYLTRLIAQTKGIQAKRQQETISYDQAAYIASSLAKLLDDSHHFGVTAEHIQSLCDGEYAEHWQPILTFLDIIYQHWPKILDSLEVQDSASYQDQILRLLSHSWKKNPPKNHIIAAGINRNIPAIYEFLNAILTHAKGAIIFQAVEQLTPELETYFHRTEHDWFSQAQAQSSPLWTTATILNHLGLTSQDVQTLPIHQPAKQSHIHRATFLADCLKPVNVFPDFDDFSDDLLDDFELIECENLIHEAQTIALIMRTQLEHKGKTAALVTPNRLLAQHVTAQLKRWGLNIDDSAGIPLLQTPVGIYLKIIAELASGGIRPKDFMALLKHPFTKMGMPAQDFRKYVRKLDLILRDAGNISGIDAITQAVFQDFYTLPILSDILKEFETRITPLLNALAKTNASPQLLLKRQLEFAQWAASSHNSPGSDELWKQEAGHSAADLTSALLEELSVIENIQSSRWTEFLNIFLQGQIVRPMKRAHPRLSIWGMVESRMMQADLVIIGSFNEGHWPQLPDVGPWLSRPMRKEIGLPSVEQEIGLNAADFLNLATAEHVIITRAITENAPMEKSRFLRRIEASLQKQEHLSLVKKDSPFHDWRMQLIKAEQTLSLRPARKPAPKPPLKARPTQLSITDFGRLMNDSYGIYGKKILNLKPLNDLEKDMDHKNFGILAHTILEIYMRENHSHLLIHKQTELSVLQNLAIQKLDELNLPKPQYIFWKIRLDRLCQSFFDQELQARKNMQKTWLEIEGSMQFRKPLSTFTLKGKADRIDLLEDGNLRIVDYKTGRPPAKSKVTQFKEPQLLLEAILARHHGFKELSGEASSLEYWHVSGNLNPKSETILLQDKYSDLIDHAYAKICETIDHFNDENTAYEPYNGGKPPSYGSDYDHLSRYKEWQTHFGDDHE